MKRLSVGQRRLIAEFLANIGVGWFIAGVVGSIPFWDRAFWEIIVSFLWGTFFSLLFLQVALSFLKGVR